MPPLRDRRDDIPNLAGHFIARFAAEESKRIDGIEPQAIGLLQRYPWPGNVRQLENAVFRAIVLADGNMLTVKEFPQIAAHVEGYMVQVPAAPKPQPKTVYSGPAMIGAQASAARTIELTAVRGAHMLGIPALTETGDIRPLNAIEADMIRLALGHYRGHMTVVAKRLGIGRSTLYRKMREFGLDQVSSAGCQVSGAKRI